PGALADRAHLGRGGLERGAGGGAALGDPLRAGGDPGGLPRRGLRAGERLGGGEDRRLGLLARLVGGGRVLDAVLGEPVGEAGFGDGGGLQELLAPGALLGGQHRGAGGVGGDQGAARERPVRFGGGVGGALLGVGAAAQRLAQRGGGAGAGAVGAAAVGDRAVVPAGGGDLGPVGLQEACGLVDRGALAFDGEGGLLL